MDLTRLQDYLRQSAGISGKLELERLNGGQSNPTYRLRVGKGNYILRRKPSGVLLPSAHAIDREYRVMQALCDTAVPVAKTICYCADEAILGAAFYIMEHVEGRIFWDPCLPDLAAAERRAIYDEMNRVIAAVHQVDIAAVGLGDFAKPGRYIERQLSRWSRQYKATQIEANDAMEHLMRWLEVNRPSSEETALVHGDFRIDNLIFHPSEPRILAVIDWELSTLGHPLVDFAQHCMVWRMAGKEHRGLSALELEGTGIPQEAEYIASYCRRTNRTRYEHWDYYMVFNLFRTAAIAQGIAYRAIHGNAASSEAAAVGWRVAPLARAAALLAAEIDSR